MKKYGFKIFSTILQKAPTLLGECVDFANEHKDVFLELMVVSENSVSDLMDIKHKIGDVEVRIHVPHNIMGFDAGNKSLETQNISTVALAKRAADIFKSKTIIVHAGCGHGYDFINETVRQFKLFNDTRIIVENLPCVASNAELLHGNTSEEIKYIMDKTGCGFCFDFSHAICAAGELHIDTEQQLKSFFDLKPAVYHLCDGDITKSEDMHMHFGTGNYPLKHFVNDLTDENACIVLETGRGITQHADAWFKDYEYIKTL